MTLICNNFEKCKKLVTLKNVEFVDGGKNYDKQVLGGGTFCSKQKLVNFHE